MSIVQTLTEGIVQRDMQKEGQALLNKWSQTGLLEGITDDRQRSSMARLLENQAKELLRESSAMSTGDVEGFAAVAFPIVRRVFAGLIANDLVSVQPMSLPSGLIFFLDFTFNSGRLGNAADTSLYGGGVTGSGLVNGVDLGEANSEVGPYSLNNGYASPTGSAAITLTVVASGTFGGTGSTAELGGLSQTQFDKLCRFDADFVSGTTNVAIFRADVADFTQLNKDDLVAIHAGAAGTQLTASGPQVRRLTAFSASINNFPGGPSSDRIYLYFASYDGAVTPTVLAGGKVLILQCHGLSRTT